jgi:DsbC/DsbD-like thiol-disulfide interchange protein
MNCRVFCRRVSRQWLTLALLLACASDLHATVAIPHGTVELFAEASSIRPGHSFYAGLNFRLEPGWHIYWINPGDAGEPPRVTWRLPAGITAHPLQWPAPTALPAFSDMDFGYQNQVLLLVPMTASAGLKTSAAADIGAEIKLIVCREVCIPGKAQVALSLPVTNRPPVPDASSRHLFEQARRQLPRRAPAAWKFHAVNEKDSFRLVGQIGHPVKEAFFFPLQASQIENAAPQAVQPTRSGFEMKLKKSDQLLKPVGRLVGVLKLAGQAYRVRIPVK